MLLCTKNLGCNKLDGHRSPCEKRVVKITPELVTISYRKDGKDYLLSMPSDHAEWAEEMLSLDLAEVERVAAEKAWDEGWSARASRGYAHLKVGECVPPPAHINPYRKAVES